MGLTWMLPAMYAGSAHRGHAMHGGAGSAGAAHEISTAALIGSWAVMAVAMMLPLARKQARWLAFRSLRARRQQAVAVFSGAFLAVWVAAGAAGIALLEALYLGAGALVAAGVALAT